MTSTPTDEATGRTYDETPYPSSSYPQTHPDHLAVIGTLFGMRPPTPANCRVLELGCADAGNLIPMAVNLPDAQFVGVDISARHIADGQKLVDRLGLTNIRLLHQSILDIDPSSGVYDYIIAHGVFSWVPEAVQEKILEICRQQLRPQGIAFVSYNTYPGWHLRGMLRDMMMYHTRRFEDPQQQIGQARALIRFLAGEVPTKDNPYGLLLTRELEDIQRWGDSYLRHESLEDVNEPLYFHEFAARAEAYSLRYLGESEFHTMLVSNLSPTASSQLGLLATDQIDMEQYMDFVRNRTFRQTLLCHGQVLLDRNVKAVRLKDLYAASPLKPRKGQADAESNETAVFAHRPSGQVVTVRHTFLKTALAILSEIWPQSLAIRELAALALQRSTGRKSSAMPEQHSDMLLELLLSSYAKNMVVLHVHPPCVTSSISPRPVASRLARFQVAANRDVTTQLHDRAELDDTHRQLLSLLDGTRDHIALVEQLTQVALQRNLKFEKAGCIIKDSAQIRELIAGEIVPCLQRLAENALLIG